MKKLILAALLAICPSVFAANFPIASGASTATIQSTINTAAAASGGNTVTFAAGNYSITSRITIPCPVSALTIQGPTPSGVGTTWPVTGTAVLTSTLTNNWAFGGTACSVGTTIQYLQYNGNLPLGGGGGFLTVPPGMNNLTVIYNWFYGNSATQRSTQATDMFLYLNGSLGGTPNQNVTIQWNRFGKLGGGECGGDGSGGGDTGLMNLNGDGTANPGHCSSSGYAPPSGTTDCLYQGASDITHGGGSCGAIGIQNNFSNLLIKNNAITDQEQGLKFYECSGSGCSWSSSGLVVQYNDIAGIHRIGAETQFNDVSTGGFFTYDSNDYHDAIKPNAGTWGLSLPQGTTNSTNNVLIANIASSNDKNGQPGFYAGNAIEFWGTGTSSNNLIQGVWHGGIGYGFGGTPRSINNNTIQGNSMGSNFIFNEEGTTPPPSQTGNVTGTTVTSVTSVAPTISPSAGSQTYPLTVTLTDAGYTSGARPLGNTGIWYTTDGSTPVPGTNGKYISSGGTITLSSAATVKAVGMWGALNQPTSYPTGYGFTPSAPVSAAYTGGGVVTLSSLAVTGASSQIAGAAAAQFTATGTYSNATTANLTATSTWFSDTISVCTVATTGLVTPVSAGTCNITATSGAISNTPFAVTVAAPTLTGSYLGTIPLAGVNKMTVGGQQLQFQATGTFNNGQSATITPTSWASSAPTVCTVDGNGLVTAQSAGSCNIQANGSSAPWTINVSSATLVSMSISAPTGSMPITATQAAVANGVYSDNSSGNVVPDSWTSGAPSMCTVASNGLITAVSPGTCNVTATLGLITSSPFTVQVVNPGPTLVSVKVQPSFVYASGPFTFNLLGTYSDGTTSPVASPTWSSANTSVGTVDGVTGRFTPAGMGYTQITGSVAGVTASTATVTVPPAAPFNNLPFCSFFPLLSIGTYTLNVTSGGLTIVGPN